MRVETIEISGFASVCEALRLPFGLNPRSEHKSGIAVEGNHIFYGGEATLDPKDVKLMSNLIKGGDCEAKVLRGIVVYAKITAPVMWWCEAETYRAGHERLCSESTMHIDCKGLSGDELVKTKEEIPMGKELTKVDYFSYQALRNIYIWRHNHRLPHWHEFCDWIKTLPYAEELILAGIEEKKRDKELFDDLKRFVKGIGSFTDEEFKNAYNAIQDTAIDFAKTIREYEG